MACEVNNKEVNSQCTELLVRPTYLGNAECTLNFLNTKHYTVYTLQYTVYTIDYIIYTLYSIQS